MQYSPPNAYQEVFNKNHFGSVSDRLGQLSTASLCMVNVQCLSQTADCATLARILFQCRTKINHPRHHVATKYEMSCLN